MAAGSTYTPIATQTLSNSTTASISFSSISGGYTDLVLIVAAKSTKVDTAGGLILRFNSDTNTNYSTTVLYGNGTTAASTNASNATSIQFVQVPAANSTGWGNGTIIYNIQNYSNSTTYKTALIRSNEYESTRAIVGLYRSTSAITSLIVAVTADNFLTGSTFTLYGIAAA